MFLSLFLSSPSPHPSLALLSPSLSAPSTPSQPVAHDETQPVTQGQTRQLIVQEFGSRPQDGTIPTKDPSKGIREKRGNKEETKRKEETRDRSHSTEQGSLFRNHDTGTQKRQTRRSRQARKDQRYKSATEVDAFGLGSWSSARRCDFCVVAAIPLLPSISPPLYLAQSVCLGL